MKKNLLVTLADKNFIEQAKQLFSSVYWNAGWKGDYMLLAHEIPEKDLKWFKDKGILIKKCKALYKGKVAGMSATLTSKFYLFTPEFKKWDNIIYLDADIIVRASLDKLKKINGFGAVVNSWDSTVSGQIINSKVRKERHISKKVYTRLLNELKKGYNVKQSVFCAGFMVFSTRILDKGTFSKIQNTLKRYEKISMYGEQLTFNIVFNKHWKKLPSTYCVLPSFIIYSSMLESKKIDGIVLHFAAAEFVKCQPWRTGTYFHKEWKRNLEKADLIDLKKIPLPRKKWTNLKIHFFTLYLNLRHLYSKVYPKIWCPNVKLYKESRERLKRMLYLIDRMIGLIGIFLKKHFPLLYFEIRKIKKKLGLK